MKNKSCPFCKIGTRVYSLTTEWQCNNCSMCGDDNDGYQIINPNQEQPRRITFTSRVSPHELVDHGITQNPSIQAQPIATPGYEENPPDEEVMPSDDGTTSPIFTHNKKKEIIARSRIQTYFSMRRINCEVNVKVSSKNKTSAIYRLKKENIKSAVGCIYYDDVTCLFEVQKNGSLKLEKSIGIIKGGLDKRSGTLMLVWSSESTLNKSKIAIEYNCAPYDLIPTYLSQHIDLNWPKSTLDPSTTKNDTNKQVPQTNENTAESTIKDIWKIICKNGSIYYISLEPRIPIEERYGLAEKCLPNENKLAYMKYLAPVYSL